MSTLATEPDVARMDYAAADAPPLARTERLVSLDALRGFDMFWILGADELVYTLRDAIKWPPLHHVAGQMDHTKWEGFTFYDLIFPLFIFIVGVSLVFSLFKTIARSGKAAATRRILFRFVALYLFGILYYGGMSKLWPDIRLVGVLQRIAICYLAAGLLFTYVRPRTLAIVASSLLLLYWGLMALVPVPGIGRGHFEEGKNLANYIDKVALPGRRWDGDHDPEGLLSTLPAIAGCLMGVFAGLLLQCNAARPWKKIAILLIAGAASVGLGMAWGGMIPNVHVPPFVAKLRFPVIKKIWTSSFVLITGGYSAILLGLFYLVIDVLKLRLWASPFIWIGMNAITLYLLEALFKFDGLAKRFVGGHVANALGVYAHVVQAALALAFIVLLARFLYRRGIFLRL